MEGPGVRNMREVVVVSDMNSSKVTFSTPKFMSRVKLTKLGDVLSGSIIRLRSVALLTSPPSP